jgi:hypothetical protein
MDVYMRKKSYSKNIDEWIGNETIQSRVRLKTMVCTTVIENRPKGIIALLYNDDTLKEAILAIQANF